MACAAETQEPLVQPSEEWNKGWVKTTQTEPKPLSTGELCMRLLVLAVFLLAAARALAQPPAQEELNRLTGAPAGTRCFKSIKLAQDMAKHFIASGSCPQHLRPMDPARFMKALSALGAVDKDFTSFQCQVQMSLMFRLGREWIADDKERRCAETRGEMSRKLFFQEFVQ